MKLFLALEDTKSQYQKKRIDIEIKVWFKLKCLSLQNLNKEHLSCLEKARKNVYWTDVFFYIYNLRLISFEQKIPALLFLSTDCYAILPKDSFCVRFIYFCMAIKVCPSIRVCKKRFLSYSTPLRKRGGNGFWIKQPATFFVIVLHVCISLMEKILKKTCIFFQEKNL